jgi:hypothetical protein
MAAHDGHPQQLGSTTMQDHQNPVPIAPERIAWNKGKLIGAKPAPRLGNVSTRVAHLAAYRD